MLQTVKGPPISKPEILKLVKNDKCLTVQKITEELDMNR